METLQIKREDLEFIKSTAEKLMQQNKEIGHNYKMLDEAHNDTLAINESLEDQLRNMKIELDDLKGQVGKHENKETVNLEEFKQKLEFYSQNRE